MAYKSIVMEMCETEGAILECFEANNTDFSAKIRIKKTDEVYSDRCNKWVIEFSSKTCTNWIVRYTYPSATRYEYRKVYKCQHNNFDKVKERKRDDTRIRSKGCDANIDFLFKKINRNTKKNDKYLSMGYNGIIDIVFKHTHRVNVAEAFSYLRMSTETRDKFLQYFNEGMAPATARNYHEMMLENCVDSTDLSLTLANAQINPTERQVKHLYNNWRNANFGGRDELATLETLKIKQEMYSQQGISQIVIKENPLIVLVLTPIMKRAHKEQFSREIVFVDSSGSCDQTNTCVTFLFSASKIGAIPLACILHTAQTEANYTLAFNLLKDTLGEEGFGGVGYPNIFMSDDCSAERNALTTVFPKSRLLLCIFHVSQALWRWLWNTNHQVPKELRKNLMCSFRRVMYSTCEEEVEELQSNLLANQVVQKNEQLRHHLITMFQRKKEWCLFYRNELITRGNNTNNFVEASIRIFKDIVLQRCRAFNVCALVDFIVNIFESYHKRHLLSFASSRRASNEILYMKFCSSAKNLKVEKANENTYLVHSSEDDTMLYTVYTDLALCDCLSGKSGNFCKHLCAVQEQCKVVLRNAPLLTANDKKLLAELALGTSAPLQFFDSMDVTNTDEIETEADEIINQQEYFSAPSTSTGGLYRAEEMHFKHEEAVEVLKAHFNRFAEMAAGNSSADLTNIILKLNNTFGRIQTPAQLATFFCKMKNTRFTPKQIGVQPGAISRRKIRPGLTSGARRIQAGRPSDSELSYKKGAKRKRNFAQNFLDNQPNAKSHGSNH